MLIIILMLLLCLGVIGTFVGVWELEQIRKILDERR